MLLLRLASGAIVPHAPLLLHEVNPSAPSEVVRHAARNIDHSALDLTILVTPHGAGSGVYASTSGDLAAVGVPSVEVAVDTDPILAAGLAEAWGMTILEAPFDHAAVVALALLPPTAPVLVCALTEWTERGVGVGRILEEADRLAEALNWFEHHNVGVVATGHTSAALTPRAPLTDRAEGHELAETVLHHLTEDPAGLADIPAGSWESGGGCGAGPLRLIGRLFGERVATVTAHDQSFGVGYLVAEIT